MKLKKTKRYSEAVFRVRKEAKKRTKSELKKLKEKI
jgi:hypothetical protein